MNPSDITRHLHNESASREVFDLIQASSMNDANTVQVGKTIVQELENVGLRSEWDGDPDKTITVI